MEMQKVQTPLLEKVLHPVQLPCRYSEAIESANVPTGLPFRILSTAPTVHAVMQYTQTSVPEALAAIPTAQHE